MERGDGSPSERGAGRSALLLRLRALRLHVCWGALGRCPCRRLGLSLGADHQCHAGGDQGSASEPQGVQPGITFFKVPYKKNLIF